MGDQLLTEKEVAARLNLHIQTLRNWRHAGKGIPFFKIGSAVRYGEDDVDTFKKNARVEPR